MFEELPPDPMEGAVLLEPPYEPPWPIDEHLPTAEEEASAEALRAGWTWERELVERIEERRSLATSLLAEQLEYVDALRLAAEDAAGASWRNRDEIPWRDLRAEVAAVLHVHERSAERVLDFARELVHTFPATLAGLHRADFTERHARILVDEAVGLPEELAAEYERRLLPHASVLVPPRFAVLAARIRAELSPRDLIQEHTEALAERRTTLERAPSGMAWYGALMSAEQALGASIAVNGIAKTLLVEGETRTLAQLEADVFAELLTDAAGVTLPAEAGAGPVPTPAAQRGVKPEVMIHVPVLTAMGTSDEPALLEGYGPIDAETARRLAGSASGFFRILTNPETGVALSLGRDSYRVPAELRRFLKIRDGVCRFVGCTRPAGRCEVDHTVAWAEDGETVSRNLAHLCPGHHDLKHGGRWNPVQSSSGDGVLTWTSPAGKVYTTQPAVQFPPSTARSRRPGAPPLVQTEWAAEDAAVPPF